jgi:hypothetical protein
MILERDGKPSRIPIVTQPRGEKLCQPEPCERAAIDLTLHDRSTAARLTTLSIASKAASDASPRRRALFDQSRPASLK